MATNTPITTPATSSSYNYWWPCPPGGVTMTTAPTPSIVLPPKSMEANDMTPNTTDFKLSVVVSVSPSPPLSSDDTNCTASGNSLSAILLLPLHFVDIFVGVYDNNLSPLLPRSPSLSMTYPKQDRSDRKNQHVDGILGSICTCIGWGWLMWKEVRRGKSDEWFGWPAIETQTQPIGKRHSLCLRRRCIVTHARLNLQRRRGQTLHQLGSRGKIRLQRWHQFRSIRRLEAETRSMKKDAVDERRYGDNGDRLSFLDGYENDEEFMASTQRPSSSATVQGSQHAVVRRRNRIRANSDMTINGGGD
ncbi:hypothetical protein DFS33DRAFT_1387447 [Desarmillaria ectypa]|nr:hypothetical protein DFS33DRAFT_1387447 [Desarmillaria ectypa]